MCRSRTVKLFLVFGISMWLCYARGIVAEAAVYVERFQELKAALESEEKLSIELTEDIAVSKTMDVHGEKSVNGNGHTLYRFQTKKSCFGGGFLSVQGKSLQLSNVIVSGETKSGFVYGRLLEVKRGNCVLLRDGVLCKNINKRKDMDGGGAVLVQGRGSFELRGGSIIKNKSSSGGGAVRVQKGGTFLMTSGTVENNVSTGVEAVEGFDGRGGAIWNQGMVKVSGGMIQGNQARCIKKGDYSYGGVGGMICNQGKCELLGGIFRDNFASVAGGAVYSDEDAVTRVSGGVFSSNQADQGETICAKKGKFYLHGDVHIPDIYLQKGAVIDAKSNVDLKQKMSLTAEDNRIGSVLIYTGNPKLLDSIIYLGSKKSFLAFQENGLAIRKKKGEKKKEEGEKADNDVVKIEKVISNKTEKKDKFTIQCAPRYLFCDEVENLSKDEWAVLLLKEIIIWKNGKRADEWKKKVKFDWNGFEKTIPGTFHVLVSLTIDKKQEINAKIPVMLVASVQSVRIVKEDPVQFCNVAADDNSVEIWHFSNDDRKRIKSELRKREDPFSKDKNECF